MTAREIAQALDARKNGSGWKARCPVPEHEDKHASFTINEGDAGKVLVKCHSRCDQGAVIEALRARGLWPTRGGGGPRTPSNNSANVQTSGCTLEQYAAAKRLPFDLLRALGLRQITYDSSPAVRIPYFGDDMQELCIRFRIALTGRLRVKSKAHTKLCLYGLDRLERARSTGYIVAVEGESDAQTAWHHDLPCVGIPGANNWRDDRDAEHLEGLDIYVVVEPDQGSEKLLDKLRPSRLRDRINIVRLDGFKDLSEMHIDDPERFLERWEEAKAQAIPLTAIIIKETADRRVKLASAARKLAEEPDILPLFEKALLNRGVVEEARVGKLLYLAITSRLLGHPVSAVVKGPSAGGKSYLVENVLAFFPDAAYYQLSAMSEHALAYSEEPLEHRFLVLYEAAGLASDFASYLVRSLLSEGKVRYETVVKTPEGPKGRLIERKGPTGLLVTTTEVNLHPENETRLLSISVTDSREQTKEVLRSLASEDRAGVDLAPWLALQDWLATDDCRISIPFALKLADLIPPVAVRLRRDFRAILDLIRAHALLHQETRERTSDGAIIATLADYGVVRDLVRDFVAEGVEATVPATIRETVAAVESLLTPNSPGVTTSAVGKVLAIDTSAAHRRVKTSIARGYLTNLEERKHRPARLVLGETLPEDVELLPSAECLQVCTVDEGDTPIPSPPGGDR